MPNFRCDFDVTGDLVLPPRIEELTFITSGGVRLTIKNALIDGHGHVPGLMVCVFGWADSMDVAREQLQSALAAQLDLLSFVTHSRFRITAPRRLVEWEDKQQRREFDVFHVSDAHYPPDPELEQDFLRTIAALEKAVPPDFIRTALRYFRYGLNDAQTEDQFMRFWLALEIVAENVKAKDRVPISCQACKTPMRCGNCGLEQTRVPMAKQAIENLITEVARQAEPMVSKRLFKARNGLMHGKSSKAVEADCGTSMSQIVNELGMIAWQAILSSIPLGDGPPQNFGHRDGQFASNSLIMCVRGSFVCNPEDPYPSDDKIPDPRIELKTTFLVANDDATAYRDKSAPS